MVGSSSEQRRRTGGYVSLGVTVIAAFAVAASSSSCMALLAPSPPLSPRTGVVNGGGLFGVRSRSSPTPPIHSLSMADTKTPDFAQKKGYDPLWKKKATLAESADNSVGISAGNIVVSFQTGVGEDATFLNTTASAGQPLKLVASQSGQFIKYGCGKGECGTCECLVNGKYLRPCVDVVPNDLFVDPVTGAIEPLVIKVKATKSKVVSSGKFFSFKSFILGFWNNLIGMFGFVRDRSVAKKNWEDRISFEDKVAAMTAEKKRKRAEQNGGDSAMA